MGLPGTELEDIKLWADMIEEVTAFELPCKEVGLDERAWIKKIRFNLSKLDIPHQVYFGPFEEVVTLREDYEGTKYQQNRTITLYNLDFCNEITSKIATRHKGRQLLRFEALRTILLDQYECFRGDNSRSHFIMLLTFRNQIKTSNISALFPNNLLTETQSFFSACKSKMPIPSENRHLIGTHGWVLKAFLYNTLRMYFTSPNICALFFPLVKYKGTPIMLKRNEKGETLESPMLHWMILCKFGRAESPTPDCYPGNFLAQTASVGIDKNLAISLDLEEGETNNPQQPLDSVEWFKNYEKNFF